MRSVAVKLVDVGAAPRRVLNAVALTRCAPMLELIEDASSEALLAAGTFPAAANAVEPLIKTSSKANPVTAVPPIRPEVN